MLDLTPEAKRSLKFIGKTTADIRPDLNGQLSDSVIVTAALMIVHLWMIADNSMEDIVATAFTAALDEVKP